MAENKSDNYPQLPSAPNGGQQFHPDPSLYHRPPPPTYEESQRWNPQPMYTPQAGNFYSSMSGNPPPYAGIQQQSMQYAQQQHSMPGFAPNHSHYVFNYNPQQQQQMSGGTQMSQQQQISNGMASVNINQYPTVTFNAGARFTGQGVSIPPPPPGCAPTPEQLAALQGQPVILKKKKNSFF